MIFPVWHRRLRSVFLQQLTPHCDLPTQVALENEIAVEDGLRTMRRGMQRREVVEVGNAKTFVVAGERDPHESRAALVLREEDSSLVPGTRAQLVQEALHGFVQELVDGPLGLLAFLGAVSHLAAVATCMRAGVRAHRAERVEEVSRHG